jgi:hypothetical protein
VPSARMYATRQSTSALVGTASSPKNATSPAVQHYVSTPTSTPKRNHAQKSYVRELCHIRDDRLAAVNPTDSMLAKSTVGLHA